MASDGCMCAVSHGGSLSGLPSGQVCEFSAEIPRRRQCAPAAEPGAHSIGILFSVSFQIGQFIHKSWLFFLSQAVSCAEEPLLIAEADRQEAKGR